MKKWYDSYKLQKLIRYCHECDEDFNKYSSFDNAKKLINCYKKSLKEVKDKYYLQYSIIFQYYLLSFCCLTAYFNKFITVEHIRKYNLGSLNFKNKYSSIAKRCLYLKWIAMFYLRLHCSHQSYPVDKKENRYLIKCRIQLESNYAVLLSNMGLLISSIHINERLLKSRKLLYLKRNTCKKILLNIQINLGNDLALYYNLTGARYIKRRALRTLNNIFCIFYKSGFIDESNNIKKSIDNLMHITTDMRTFTSPRKFNKRESPYRVWVSINELALNPSNDILKSIKVSGDIIGYFAMALVEYPYTIDLFNLIKQRYVSSRFYLYRTLHLININNKFTNYSDNNTYIISYNNKYVLGSYIELLEMLFKQLHSIFDQIAFLLDKYFGLNLPVFFVSFNHIFNEKQLGKKKIKKYNVHNLFSIYPNNYNNSSSNYVLKGLSWIYRNLYNKNKSNGLNYSLSQSREIRNSLEHRGLHVLKDNIHGKSYISYNDGVCYISYHKFKYILMLLIKYCRNSIILLSISLSSTMKIDYMKGVNKK